MLLAAPVMAQGADPLEPSLDLPTPPTLNFYGSPGLMDMPTAEMLPDGQFTTTISNFGGQTRLTTTFQALPWLSASFRYNGIQDWNFGGFETYYDRGFDVRFRLFTEGRYRPALTLGLQDFVGTGIYAAEYLVATKNFATPGWGPASLPGRLKLTAGVGWGRLGSYNSFGAPFGADRPAYDPNSTGGKVAYDQWFRGDAAFFGGIEWNPNERWGFKVEYSSDAYNFETGVTSVFERKSNYNFGVEYQASERTRLGAYYMYGSEIGVTAQFQLNPAEPANRLAAPAPVAIEKRPARATNPEAYDTAWAQSTSAGVEWRDRLAPELRKEGIGIDYITLSGSAVELRYRNLRYNSQTIAAGRAARVLARMLPASVETFHLVPMSGAIGLSAITMRRSDLEALEFEPDATDALLAVTGITEAGKLPPTAVPGVALYPNFAWGIGPYFDPAYFDPDVPIRMDFGLQIHATYEFSPTWKISGEIRHRLFGNNADGRGSNSVLPPVRTNQVLYAQEDTTLHDLYIEHRRKVARNVYGRATLGYLESMFAGVSTELLWKPVQSPLGLGVEANYVRQREFDQRFGLQDYSVLTGHASAYLEMGNGFVGQLDVGRYLAGDVGATVSLDRTFANGWSVGGWFTLTDVSSEDFGEGSFDKGIRFSIPVNWFFGKPTRQSIGTGIRPIQRDGGQRLNVPGRLYGQVRDAHAKALRGEWARVWE